MNRPLVDARGTAVSGTLPQALTTSTLTSNRSAVRMGTDVTQRQSVDTPALTLVQKPRVYVLVSPGCPASRPGSTAVAEPESAALRRYLRRLVDRLPTGSGSGAAYEGTSAGASAIRLATIAASSPTPSSSD